MKTQNTLFKFFSTVFVAITVLLLFSSCRGSASDEGENAVTYFTISSEGGNEKLLGKPFTFKVLNNLNQDVTAESRIFVDGSEIQGNTYTPSVQGNHTVTAKYKDLPGNPITISVLVNEGINFKHRILYEEYTGTWCGYCTIGLKRHENLLQQTQDLVFIGIHGPVGTNDPWTSPLSTEFETFKNVKEWPTMFINRATLWPYNSDVTDMSVPLGQLNASSKIGIKMNSAINGNNMTANVDVLFTNNFTNLKIASFIVEDELVHDQKNYLPNLYGGVLTIPNFVHHNVLRNKLTPITGDVIPNDQSSSSKEFHKNLQFTIPANYNQSKLKLIVMIMDNSGKVLNVREEKLGISNNYEFL